MGSQLEIEDYFIRKFRGMAVTPIEAVLVLSKILRGYVPDGRLWRIACSSRFRGGVVHFTEVKVIRNNTSHYMRANVRDNHKKATAVNTF